VKKNIVIAVVLCSLLLILSILIFVISISMQNPIIKRAVLVDFSFFISAIIAFVNMIVVGALTILIYDYNQKVTEDRIIHENILEKPILAFRMYERVGFYTVQNVGKGAAINVKVKSNLDLENRKWDQLRLSYSLQSGEGKEMSWTYNCNAISAEYSDIFGTRYCSYMRDDDLKVICLDENKDLLKYKIEIELNSLDVKRTLQFSHFEPTVRNI